MKKNTRKMLAAMTAAAMCVSLACAQIQLADSTERSQTVHAATISDLPSEYQYAADWIWENRIVRENSTGRWNTIFDQIIAGKGTINYVVKWQSYRQVTLEQRRQFETMLSDAINAWTDWLVGYENWPYDHVDVKVVGWAVIDPSCILDPQPDEIIYTDTKFYDSQYDTSNGVEEIPNLEPYAPDELSRMYHYEHRLDPTFDAYNYPGGLDKRFDMYMWATQGFPSIGGCGGDWGQRLSDTAFLNMLGGSNLHVQIHELGHGFGITDFYGGEGAIDGFPPGGFPGNGSSIMMAGSSAQITDFDGWLLRYMWTKLKDEQGRFDLANAQPDPTDPTNPTDPSVTPTEPTTEPTTEPPVDNYMEFADGTMIALKNANSGLFLGVENAAAGNMANVCQSGTGSMEQNIWTLKSAGNGYYYLYSRLAGGEQYLLDVYYAETADGTNIGLYEFTNSPAQLFKFVDNGDGTCRILTCNTGDAGCLQTAGASADANANVEQSTWNGGSEQKWIIRTPQLLGYKGDCSKDTQVTADDTAQMQAHILNKTPLSGLPVQIPDMNEDGVINAFDLAMVKKAAGNEGFSMPIYICED